MNRWKDNVSFILIETIQSGNIGASARALKNLGFSRLELVRPAEFPSDKAGWFAHGAEDILSKSKVYAELEHAMKDKTVIIGTTRRVGKKRGIVYPVRDAADRIRHLSETNRIALLFGREDRGLTNEETAACSFMIRIPTAPENPSFNLAQAVLIVAYELFCSGYAHVSPPSIISNKELSNLFRRLRRVMTMIGYAPKGIRDDEEGIMTDLKRLIARIAITEREARMLHGIISQIEKSARKNIGS
ncbi:MAG TPA: RNA methyltransferase [Thermodesulfovibrionales bacterium]|nr:RNA methyltransferase [Thermodesulfovibrionales bacterium]